MMEDANVDYRKMYYHLASAVETAPRILITAQQDCENILLDSDVSPYLEESVTSLHSR